jgi:membrane fusion protein (multidrug efflux system)
VVDGTDKDSKVSQRVEVKVGIRRPGKVEIVEGLGEGDTVVIAGQQRIQKDGSALRILDINRPRGEGAPGAGQPPGAGASAAAATPSAPATAGSAPALPAQLAAAAKAPQGPNPCQVDMGGSAARGEGGSGRAGEGSGRKGEVRGAPARS